jgi:hypothetical protein
VTLDPGDSLHREVRDSVPVYWAPEAPRLTGVLMFRVGRADETAITGGLSHQVEHLALYTLGAKQSYAYNGMVNGIRTVFHATGKPDEVASFINRVCEAIAKLPLERAEAESRVLRTEAAGRVTGPVEELLWYRFGSAGHGLPRIREYALEAPDKAAVASWASERFTAENAAAWFSGPVPPGVSFAALPRGRRIPCPEPVPLARLRTPAYRMGKSGGIAASFVTDREDWISLPWQIAAMRLRERLRFRQGVTYSVQLSGQPVSATRLHSAILAGCLDEHAGTVLEGLLEVLDALARDGPTMEEMKQIRENHARTMADPDSVPLELDPACLNELIGFPVKSQGRLLREMEELRPERQAASVRSALDTALLMVPPGCPAPKSPFVSYPPWSEKRMKGTRFRRASQRFPWSKKSGELIAGREGVSVVLPGGVALTVFYDACAGVVIYPDGTVHVIGKDAVSLWIRPANWRHGQRACDVIVRSAPVDLLRVIPAR